MTNKTVAGKCSAQLAFGSCEWAFARLRENAEDRYALMIKLKCDAPKNSPSPPPPTPTPTPAPGVSVLPSGRIKI